MKIIRYHMLIVNTYNALEAEVKLENGDIVYPHIDVPKENGIKIDKNHPYYGSEVVYNRPLSQISSNDDAEGCTYIMDERENLELFVRNMDTCYLMFKDEIIVEAARRIDYELMYGRNSISEDDDGAYSNSYIDISDIS